jgi:uncharacterized repeat protein (TIGR01451 family)
MLRSLAFVTILSCAHAHAWRMEAGEATFNSTYVTSPAFTTVLFQEPFDVVPIVLTMPTDEGSEPASARIRNVTTTGFEIAPVEPEGGDGPHVGMTVHYVAIEPGSHLLPGGTSVVAHTHTTTATQGRRRSGTSWDTIVFPASPGADPVLLTTLQTMNSEQNSLLQPSVPWLTPSVRSVSSSGAQIAMDFSETRNGTVVPEIFGYLAIQAGTAGAFNDVNGNTVQWAASRTPTRVVGWDDGCTMFSFSATVFSAPRVIFSANSRRGGDGGWMRRCNITGSSIGLVVDEDQAWDTERRHTSEEAALLAFSRSFHARFGGDIALAKRIEFTADPTGGDLSIPGARTRYAIELRNTGTVPIDADSVEIVDAIPAETVLLVSDLGIPGTGPVRFTDGAPASSLSYTFISLSDATDDLEFSSDGGATYTYTPTPDTTGADGSVTHIRINPKGVFANGSGPPSATFEFDVLIR